MGHQVGGDDGRGTHGPAPFTMMASLTRQARAQRDTSGLRRAPGWENQAPGQPRAWRGGRVVDGSGLENRRPARVRGFESHPLRFYRVRRDPRKSQNPCSAVDLLCWVVRADPLRARCAHWACHATAQGTGHLPGFALTESLPDLCDGRIGPVPSSADLPGLLQGDIPLGGLLRLLPVCFGDGPPVDGGRQPVLNRGPAPALPPAGAPAAEPCRSAGCGAAPGC